MKSRSPIGGVIHTYQKYDPQHLPSPRQPPPDVVSGAFEHMLAYGDLRELTDEELARAVRLDPSQIAGLGPSLDALMAMLRERKRKILETYETERVEQEAAERFQQLGPANRAAAARWPERFRKAVERRATLRPGAALVSRWKTSVAAWPEGCSGWWPSWATNIRSTSWRPNMPSPAARR